MDGRPGSPPGSPSGERLARFLAASSPAEALAIWLEPRADDPRPARADLVRRLLLDVADIDDLLTSQVDAILHHERFAALEAAWRGLAWLCEEVEDPDRVHVRVLDLSWRELARDLERAIDFDHSNLFRKVYSAEFGTPGGQPFGVLLGDYRVCHRPSAATPQDDVAALRSISRVAAAAFAPFLCSIHPAFLGMEDFADFERHVDLERTFAQVEYGPWRAFRADEDARFVGLLLPHLRLRAPWEDTPRRADGFRYRESNRHGGLLGNPIWAFGSVLVRAFARTSWLADIRGVVSDVDGGGLVVGPVQESFATDRPGTVPKPVTEVVISDVLERQLADQGLIALTHCPGTSLAAFYSIPSVKRTETLETPEATVNARLGTMLHYLLCVSRFAHYLKVLGRDKVGSFWTPEECETFLNDWLHPYTTSNPDMDPQMLARYPLREARAEVSEFPGKPGVYRCVVHLRPHFQLDQMSSSVRLVTELVAAVR